MFLDGQVYRTSDVVRRTDPMDGLPKLYDKKHHSFDFTGRTPVYFDVVYYFRWSDLPKAFQRWITHQASVKAATQLISNQELVQMLMIQEQKAQAACQQYEKLNKVITASLAGILMTMLSIAPINLTTL